MPCARTGWPRVFLAGDSTMADKPLDLPERDVERFLLDFDTGMAPAVGYQVTFNGANNGDATLAARTTGRTQWETLRAQIAAQIV